MIYEKKGLKIKVENVVEKERGESIRFYKKVLSF